MGSTTGKILNLSQDFKEAKNINRFLAFSALMN
jgi:hypothetical protein